MTVFTVISAEGAISLPRRSRARCVISLLLARSEAFGEMLIDILLDVRYNPKFHDNRQTWALLSWKDLRRMKKSKLEAAETRRRIVRTAAAEFRRSGIHATGLAELMAAAGLTHGGFYRHFESKNQLVAEACVAGMDLVVGVMEAAACGSGGKNGFERIVDSYLSTDHRDNRSEGCPLAGLGSELARADDNTRAAASTGFLRLVDVVAKQFRRTRPDVAKEHAVFALSAMIGAVTMSRLMTDPELSASILRDTKKHLANV
jgi:TetR/AcrR family transcriptional repressor of nem operon